MSIQRFSSPREYRDNNSGLHCQGSITVKFDFADPPLTHAAPIPGFDLDTALRTLNIARIAFDEINGNVQGFARQHEIGINPLAALPHKTTFHEIAHVVLGHTTSEKLVDGEHTPRHLCEVEAESVALISCETLGLDGAEFSRGYIQHWLNTETEIPNHNAGRIFATATSILKAGIPAAGTPSAVST